MTRQRTPILAAALASAFLVAAFAPVLPAYAQGEAPKTAAEGAKKAAPAKRKPSRISVRHVLVSFAGLERPVPGVTRNKEAAQARAKEVLAKLRAGGDFDKLVQEYSDDPGRAGNKGRLGIVQAGRFSPQFKAFEDAIFALDIGKYSEILETPMGLHVVQRTEIVEWAASHILIQYKGSQRAKPTIVRSKEEAKKLTEEIVAKAKAAGADFAALARQHSDGPSGPQGGSLGVFQPGQMVAPFEEALKTLAVGAVSGVVETPFGFHVIKRTKIERIGAAHILIQYKGSQRAKPTVTRTKEEAKKLATELLAKAKAAGADFADLARKNSDGPSGPQGGDLGVFERGAMVPAFEKAAFALDVGALAEVVETPFGFHVIKRTE